MNLTAVQSFMRERGIGAWLVHDFRGNNPVLARLLGGAGKRWTTRRAVLLIPATGEPRLLAHTIDASQFEGLPVKRETYTSWRELQTWLAKAAEGGRVAMEYSPGAALPVVSVVDGGTVDLLRGLGAEVVSSADLMQVGVAVWSEEARRNHARASKETERVKDGAFSLIRERLAAGREVGELEVQGWMAEEFKRAGLEASEPPIVAVNAHSGDPHYEPKPGSASPIRKGDWVLIDLWARVPGEENIYSDITWVGYAGRDVPARHREVFAAVKRARDASVRKAQGAWRAKERVQGWELDEAAAAEIRGAGLGQFIRHRTGHSLSPGPMVHGLGMNLDNLETRDTREMLAGIGFTVEPGAYLPEFGVRLEINLWVDPREGPVVTSCVQDEVVTLV